MTPFYYYGLPPGNRTPSKAFGVPCATGTLARDNLVLDGGNDPPSTPYQDVANPSQLIEQNLEGHERIKLPPEVS